MRNQKGYSLIELVVAAAIVAVLFLSATGAVESARRRSALLAAVSEVRTAVMHVRTLAIARNRNVAIRFTEESPGRWAWTVYEDGDGDGVRNDDIQKNVDRRISPTRRIAYTPARIGVPDDPVPDPLNAPAKLQSRPPVRYGASRLCSFNRHGEVTNGSLVLTDGINAAIVRTWGTTGRVAVLRWNGTVWKTGS